MIKKNIVLLLVLVFSVIACTKEEPVKKEPIALDCKESITEWWKNQSRIPDLDFFAATYFYIFVPDKSKTSCKNIGAFLIDLKNKGHDPSTKDKNGLSPLHTCVTDSQLPIAKALIKMGVDVNAKDNRGQTPLLGLIGTTGYRTINKLISAGADVKAVDNYGRSALTITDLQFHIMELLIESGADVNHVTKEGYTPLMKTVAESMNSETTRKISLLIQKKANLNYKTAEGKTFIFFTDPLRFPSNNDAELVGYFRDLFNLLEKEGVDISLEDNNGLNILNYANRAERPKYAEFLKTLPDFAKNK